ncbi:MAG: phenylacetic acid catabolic family protein, partial [Myxococcaceae bacterium]|nr:phenylacetic acid catabolic family protein [Myxococcaceae bacterium]
MQSETSTSNYDESFAPLSIKLATFKNTPEEFQKLVIRLMSIQAYAEKVAAIGVPDWTRKAPDFRAVRTLGKIIADEARHAFLLYSELEAIGVTEKQADAIATGKESGSASLDGPGALDDNDLGWLDMIM